MSELHIAVMPLALVDDLSFEFAHAGVSLGLGSLALHHTGDVEVLDYDGLELVDQLRGHLVLGVTA